MNALAERDWREDVREVPIVDLAEALGFERASGRGERSRYRLPHANCDGTHSSGEPAVYVARKANRLKCRSCDARMGGVDLVAMALSLNPDRLDSDGWSRVRDVAASNGWCMPDPRRRSGVDYGVWRQERAAQKAEREALQRAVECERRAGAIDVHRAWQALNAAQAGRTVVVEWARDVRGIPEGLIDHLPWDDLAGVPFECPRHPLSVDVDGWREAVRLMTTGHAIDRRILIAQRDAEGRPVGASRRWHRAGSPSDGMAKALALSAEQALEGSPSDWPGGTAMFGDLPVAIAKARRGEPIILLEGGPDWLIASAALRRSHCGAALGAPGAGAMAKIAAAIRMALWAGPQPRVHPRVTIIPDRGDAGARAAWDSAAALRAAAHVTVRRTGADDLNDLVRTRKRTAETVIDFLLRGVGR